MGLILKLDWTVSQAIREIRNSNQQDQGIYFYVVDNHDQLVGIVKSKDLISKDKSLLLKDLTIYDIKTISCQSTFRKALDIMQENHLLAIPVVKEKKLLGVIDIQSYFDKSLQLDTAIQRREVFQTLGVELEDGKREQTLKQFVSRLPWLFCNILGGLFCAIVSDIYEVVLSKVIVLAMFIPLVLSLSESISMQSMTQSIHAVKKKFSFWKQTSIYLYHEAKLLFLLSLTCSLVVGFTSLLWGDGWPVAYTIALSIFVSILITAIFGAVIPLILHHFKLDPKVASGPIVLMFADVVTTVIYLSIGFWFLLG